MNLKLISIISLTVLVVFNSCKKDVDELSDLKNQRSKLIGTWVLKSYDYTETEIDRYNNYRVDNFKYPNYL